MKNTFLKELELEVADLRDLLVNHPVYSHIKTIEHLTCFMESHVYAVWDFMSLLKALQINLTCVQIPWRPVGNASTRYLINEIVTGEESDVDQDGNRLSHFELYLNAMHQAGANTALVSSLIDDITGNKPIEEVLNNHSFSPAAKQFMEFTFQTIATEQPHLMATVFTFGREDLIPDMFISFIKELKKQLRVQEKATETAKEHLFSIKAGKYAQDVLIAGGISIIDTYKVELLGVTSNVLASRTFKLNTECSIYPTIRLHWMNKLGAFDSFNFNKNTINAMEIERKQFKAPLPIGYSKQDGLWCQSRERILSVEKDNAGFAFWVESNKEYFEKLQSGRFHFSEALSKTTFLRHWWNLFYHAETYIKSDFEDFFKGYPKEVSDTNLIIGDPLGLKVHPTAVVEGAILNTINGPIIIEEGAEVMVICAQLESDIAELESYEERQMFLQDAGLTEPGVNKLITAAYKLLKLSTYFTAGVKEVRAWTIKVGFKAPQAAGVIHTDFEKGFIRAEVIKYEDFVKYGSEAACRDAGKLSIEGKEYVVGDGDVMHFRFNV